MIPSKAVQEVDEKREKKNKLKRDYYHKNKILKWPPKEERPARKVAMWLSNMKRKYGLSKEDYNTLLLSQGGCCAICGAETDNNLFVDHNHSSGKVRGLLCRACNTGLGNFSDNEYFLFSAIKYLLKDGG